MSMIHSNLECRLWGNRVLGIGFLMVLFIAVPILLAVPIQLAFAQSNNAKVNNAKVTTSANPEIIQREQTVGPVDVKLTLEPAAPLIGDVVKFTIEVIAEKDVELLMPEFGEALDRFAIVDFAPKQVLNAQQQTVATQVYRLQPPSSGKQTIPPILIEFVDRREGKQEAPEGLDAYEVLTERIEFEVQSVLPENANVDLHPPLGKLAPLETEQPTNWIWLALAIVSLIIAGVVGFKLWLQWSQQARRRSAYEIALGQLEKLLTSPPSNPSEMEAFYVKLSGIVRHYLENRFDLRAPELTTEEFLASVSGSPDLTQDHQQLLVEFLKQADLVKFARVQPTEDDVNRSIEAARRFLEETRENAPLLEVDAEEDRSTEKEISPTKKSDLSYAPATSASSNQEGES